VAFSAEAVQRGGGGAAPAAAIHQTAAEGLSGPSGSLPFQGAIQASFGEHSVAGIQAHVGGSAAKAAGAMGAAAYATGESVAFKEAPSLHTAAHEAAHVVQQRAGVSVPGGVGQRGDSYEKHADAVADAVVQGKSAQGVLDGGTAPSANAPGAAAIQRSEETDGSEQTDADTGGGAVSPDQWAGVLRAAIATIEGMKSEYAGRLAELNGTADAANEGITAATTGITAAYRAWSESEAAAKAEGHLEAFAKDFQADEGYSKDWVDAVEAVVGFCGPIGGLMAAAWSLGIEGFLIEPARAEARNQAMREAVAARLDRLDQSAASLTGIVNGSKADLIRLAMGENAALSRHAGEYHGVLSDMGGARADEHLEDLRSLLGRLPSADAAGPDETGEAPAASESTPSGGETPTQTGAAPEGHGETGSSSSSPLDEALLADLTRERVQSEEFVRQYSTVMQGMDHFVGALAGVPAKIRDAGASALTSAKTAYAEWEVRFHSLRLRLDTKLVQAPGGELGFTYQVPHPRDVRFALVPPPTLENLEVAGEGISDVMREHLRGMSITELSAIPVPIELECSLQYDQKVNVRFDTAGPRNNRRAPACYDPRVSDVQAERGMGSGCWRGSKTRMTFKTQPAQGAVTFRWPAEGVIDGDFEALGEMTDAWPEHLFNSETKGSAVPPWGEIRAEQQARAFDLQAQIFQRVIGIGSE